MISLLTALLLAVFPPCSPTNVDQIYTDPNGTKWQCNGTIWIAAVPIDVNCVSGCSGGGGSGGGSGTASSVVTVDGGLIGELRHVSGGLITIDGGNVNVANFPASQPVTGTFWPSAQVVVVDSGTVDARVTNLPTVQSVTLDGGLANVTVVNFPATISATLDGGLAHVIVDSAGAVLSFTADGGSLEVSKSALPTGASTEATLALIKAKTDNLDVALSTRTKPADSQTVTGTVAVSNSFLLDGTFTARINTLGQKVMASSTPVVIASDQSALPVTGTFWQTTQPISIATMPSTPVTGTFWQSTQPVSGTVTTSPPSNASTNISQWGGTSTSLGGHLAASSIPVVQATDTPNQCAQSGTWNVNAAQSGSWIDTVTQSSGANLHVNVDSAPTTAVTGTFFQATQPVSIATMPSTPVTGTFFQATQPVTGGVSVDGGVVLTQGLDYTGALQPQRTDTFGVIYTQTIPAGPRLPLPSCNPVRKRNCQ